MTTVETERLVLRRFAEQDLDAFAAIVADEGVMRFMGGPRDRATAWSDMTRILGHWVARGHWGRGLATEAARASLEYAFDVVGADHVISLINPRNTASIRVAEKLGGRLQRRIEMFGGEVLLYGVDRAG